MKQRGKKKNPRRGLRALIVPGMISMTVLIAAGGFFLPSFLMRLAQSESLAETGRVDAGTDVIAYTDSATSVEPLTKESLQRLIRRFAHMDEDMFYHEALAGEMSELEAVSRARAELREMTDAGLLPSAFSNLSNAQYTALLSTAVYSIRDVSQIDPFFDIWQITFMMPGGSIYVNLHASSGKILSLAANITNKEILGMIDQIERGDLNEDNALMTEETFAALELILYYDSFDFAATADAYFRYLGVGDRDREQQLVYPVAEVENGYGYYVMELAGVCILEVICSFDTDNANMFIDFSLLPVE